MKNKEGTRKESDAIRLGLRTPAVELGGRNGDYDLVKALCGDDGSFMLESEMRKELNRQRLVALVA